MGAIPNEIPELGAASVAPRQNPEWNPLSRNDLGSEDYYVWSRVDGKVSFKDLILMTGMAPARAIEVLRRLRGWGALLLPGETPESVRPPPPPPTIELGPLRAGEREALAEQVDIPEEERKNIIAKRRLALTGDYYALLEVPLDADRKELKRAYFRLSKELHPDRYYGKRTGSFGAWLAQVFEVGTRAYQVLGDSESRARYDEERRGGKRSETPATLAARLHDQAVAAEAGGDRNEALRLFASALRADPQARIYRRAAACALAAADWKLAQEYAKKANELQPTDPSVARILARAYKGLGQLGEAEETLVYALCLKIDNDRLVAELEEDLAEVRKQLSGRS